MIRRTAEDLSLVVESQQQLRRVVGADPTLLASVQGVLRGFEEREVQGRAFLAAQRDALYALEAEARAQAEGLRD